MGIEKLITEFLAFWNSGKFVPLIEAYFSCKSTKPILVTNALKTPQESHLEARDTGLKKKMGKLLVLFKNWVISDVGKHFPLFSLKHDRFLSRKMEC